jgi:DNA-directed RNA polymerase specialized sigma24 family protein
MSHVRLEELERLTADVICSRCREETARFRRHEPHDDRFCFDMIRRAIVDQDEGCWVAMTEIYRDLVLGWCRRSGGEEAAIADFAAEVWARFWQNYTVEKLNSAGRSTAAVLAYLKLCARSVVLDDARRRERTALLDPAHPETVNAIEGTPAGASPRVESADQEAFWSLILSLLKDERERLLVYLSYELDLTPAEIQRRYPDHFPTVDDVYKGRRNILDRLSRNKGLARWLASQD